MLEHVIDSVRIQRENDMAVDYVCLPAPLWRYTAIGRGKTLPKKLSLYSRTDQSEIWSRYHPSTTLDVLTFASMVGNRDWSVTDAPGVRVESCRRARHFGH